MNPINGYMAVHGGIRLAPGSLVRIDDGKGLFVYLWDGELHVTQEGDQRDHFVRAGRSFHIQRHGVSLLHAVKYSAVTLMAALPRRYARRITLSAPGMRKLIYDRGLLK